MSYNYVLDYADDISEKSVKYGLTEILKILFKYINILIYQYISLQIKDHATHQWIIDIQPMTTRAHDWILQINPWQRCKVRFNQFYKYTLFTNSIYLIVGVPFSGQLRPNVSNQRRGLEVRNEEATDILAIAQPVPCTI